jgi:Ca2+-binding EF-hand superfamily protein
VSLSKLREYHGSFKSIADNYAIDLREFEQIFGRGEGFDIWDDDRNGLIDSMELFSGLILFSDSKFEDKIRCLFDFFDFNDLNSLAFTDILLMLSSCIKSIYKIHGITTELNQEDLQKFVVENFADDARVNISQLIKWCCQNTDIQDFFMTIKKEKPEIREGALKTNIVDGRVIDPIFLETTSNKLFQPVGKL